MPILRRKCYSCGSEKVRFSNSVNDGFFGKGEKIFTINCGECSEEMSNENKDMVIKMWNEKITVAEFDNSIDPDKKKTGINLSQIKKQKEKEKFNESESEEINGEENDEQFFTSETETDENSN